MTKGKRAMKLLKVLESVLKPVASCNVLCLEAFKMFMLRRGGDMAQMLADKSTIIVITFG
jgi:hypothetical protein